VIQEYNEIMLNISNYPKIEKVIYRKHICIEKHYNIEMISIFISAEIIKGLYRNDLPDKFG